MWHFLPTDGKHLVVGDGTELSGTESPIVNSMIPESQHCAGALLERILVGGSRLSKGWFTPQIFPENRSKILSKIGPFKVWSEPFQPDHAFWAKNPCLVSPCLDLPDFHHYILISEELEKAVAISEIFSGVLGRKIPGKFRKDFAQIANFWDWERQTCREPWVDTPLDLVPPSVQGVFLDK